VKRRYFFLLMVVVLLIGYGMGQAVQASDPLPGSDQDPLVTKSYVDNYISSHYTDLQAQLTMLTQQVVTLEQRLADMKQTVKVKIQLVIGEKTALVGSQSAQLPVAPFLAEGGYTMLPFRFIGEALGADIGWEAETKTVSYTVGSKELKLQIGSKTALVNGEEMTLSAPPMLKDGSTVVPVRVVVEGLGAKVDWDKSTKTVTIIP